MSTTWTDILTAEELTCQPRACDVTYQLSTWSGEFTAKDLLAEFERELSDVREALASMPRNDSYAREVLATMVEPALIHIIRMLLLCNYPEPLPIR